MTIKTLDVPSDLRGLLEEAVATGLPTEITCPYCDRPIEINMDALQIVEKLVTALRKRSSKQRN